jgi:preprotein translocase subunit SecA
VLGSLGRFTLHRGWQLVARHLPFRSAARTLARINHLEPRYQSQTDDELRRTSLSLRYRALSGESLETLMPEAYALVRESSRRTLGMRHFDVQILGGIAMQAGAIAEMQTGEGKTLTAALPLYLAALLGQGAHLATANDYLARRDAEVVRPALALLGMTLGIIDASTPRIQRRQAYKCDVTYAASRELGFDFLRDRLVAGREGERQTELLAKMLGHEAESGYGEGVQRALTYCLVDEADSILIDEARTPLIVSAMPGSSPDSTLGLFQWSAKVTSAFQEHADFEHDARNRTITLTRDGRRKVRELSKPEVLADVGMLDMYEHIERALLVEREYLLNRHYVLRDGEIVIVDEFTGRLAVGRKWRSGIHQAIEAKEGVEITLHAGEAARVTVQDYFLRYQRLAGMTGTAASSTRELRRIYKLQVQVIPTHRPCRRQSLRDLVFATAQAKWQAVVEEVSAMHAQGRPVLIGTRSIDKSEHLSQLLHQAGIEHQVLNARRHAEEAQIVAQAGQVGRVTVATNMAGRGTDIKLAERVNELGGLHVIGTELHESARVDRQLAGRCARQGDPGSFRQFMSLEDDILAAGFGVRRASKIRKRHRASGAVASAWARTLRQAQRRVQKEHFRQRRVLLYQAQRRRETQQELGQDPYLDASL